MMCMYLARGFVSRSCISNLRGMVRPHLAAGVNRRSVGHCLDNSTLSALVQVIQLAHILLANIKVVDVGVVLDSAGSVTLGQRDL